MKTIRLDKFKGINNKANVNQMPDGFLREMVNFNVDNSGIASQRSGYRLITADVFRSLYSDGYRCFAIKGGNLVEITKHNGVYSFTVLRANVGYSEISFTRANGIYYYVSATVTGKITPTSIDSFGIEKVSFQPTLGSAAGNLLAGTYQIAVTFLDSNGMESGTISPAIITITANQSITLSNIPVSSSPRVAYVAIYCSNTNGAELFRTAIIPNGTTTHAIIELNATGFALATMGINPAPFGNLIAYHYSHVYISSGKYLFYSEKFHYERWLPINHYKYPSNITAIMPCENGLWIATENSGLFWREGRTPKHGVDAAGDMSQIKKHNAKIKKGSEKLIPAEFLGQASPSYGWHCTADEGVFLLMDQGQFLNESQDNINLPAFLDCAGAIISDRDSYKYVAMLSNTTEIIL